MKIRKARELKSTLEMEGKRQLAFDTYSTIINSLTIDSWPGTRDLLLSNRDFLIEHLGEKERSNIEEMVLFFRHIEEGDLRKGERPESLKEIGEALESYHRAEEHATAISKDINIGFIAEQRISEVLNLKEILEEGNKKRLARETYDRMIGMLTHAEWEKARSILLSDLESLRRYLDEAESSNVENLSRFFMDIADGDRTLNENIDSIPGIDSAVEYYRKAAASAGLLPRDMDVRSLAEMKIRKARELKSTLEMKGKRQLALDTYNEIMSMLRLSRWEEARNQLYENRLLIKGRLDHENNEVIEKLINFFDNIDKGDILCHSSTEDMENIDSALLHYKRAEQISRELKKNADLIFIARQKITEVIGQKKLLEKKHNETLAETAFEKILGALEDREYESAKNLLYHNLQFMGQHLDPKRKLIIGKLLDIFQDIEEGERLLHEKPATVRNLGKALRLLKRAEKKAEDLPMESKSHSLQLKKLKPPLIVKQNWKIRKTIRCIDNIRSYLEIPNNHGLGRCR